MIQNKIRAAKMEICNYVIVFILVYLFYIYINLYSSTITINTRIIKPNMKGLKQWQELALWFKAAVFFSLHI